MSPWSDVNTEQTQHDFDTTEKKEGTYYVGPDGSLHQVNSGVGQKVGQRGKGVENGRTAADMERIKGLIPIRDALRQVYTFDLKGDTGNAERARAQLNKSYDEFVAKFGPINKAVIQTRRPNVIQMEAARAEAREEARYADARFREGTFDATDMLDAKVPLSVIARERQKAREEAAKAGLPFDEGDFDIDEVPDVIIDKRPNVDPFMDDPESYRLRAIERYDEGTGQGHKSPVFFENIITREVTPKISSVNDGLLYSLSQYGRVNIPAIAELTKKTDAEVVEGLGEQVFKVPGTKDSFVTRDEYLSGNVRKKLELAQKAADRNPEFRRNVAALEASQPMPLAPSQIHASLGMPWIPQAEIEKFGMEELGLEKLRVRYQPTLASWTVSGDTDSVAARSTWGTEQKRAPAIMQSALNRQTIKVYDEVYVGGKKSSVLNVAKTEAANDKLMAMREKFSGWLWADQERADRLAAYYNENYNNLVVREYDGSYLTTPGIASHWSWRPHQKRVIARIIQSGNTYVAHAVGAGKAQPLDAKILTPDGWSRMGDIAVGDHVISKDGSPTLVTGVYPQGEKEIFRVTFSDGSSTECCEDHLWQTWNYAERSAAQRAIKLGKKWAAINGGIRSLAEIRKTLRSPRLNALNHSIPIVDAVAFNSRPVPLDPYLVGAILGDGTLRSDTVGLSTADDEMLGFVADALPEECELRHSGAYDYRIVFTGKRTGRVGDPNGGTFSSNPVKGAFVDLGLYGHMAHDKFIPDVYRFNTVDVRIAVLQGLMDTDGWVSQKGHSTYFTSTSKRLADDVVHLVRSLGGTASVTTKKPSFTYLGVRKTGRDAFNVCIKMPNGIVPFRLTRKISAAKTKTKYVPVRYIVSVESVGRKLSQCIKVAHLSSLYVTDDFVVTHNTSEYIGAIMEMRRLGLVRKPMVAVPNHMLAQFTKEWYEQYPTARLAIADDKRFHTDRRKQFVANVALDDLDAIIITHSSFGMIPVSAEFENSIIEREIGQYRQVLAEIKNDGDSRITRSRIEKQIERLEQRLVSRKGRKDSTFTFEEMGVDHLTIDEAHLFRKLDFTTAMSNLKGVSPEGSQMAWDLYIKSQYLNSIRPGRGLVLGSGTPITNTMAELYTLSRYMQPDVLAERGLEKFDAWAGAFGESVSELEQDAAGNYKPVSRFAKFVNVAELSAMVRQVMDVVTSKQLEQYVTRPQVKSGKRQMVLAEKSRALVRFQENLASRMKIIQERKGPPAKGDDIMLSVINDGRHAAIDMRLAGGDRSEVPSKLDLMIDNVYQIWADSKRQKFHKVAKEGGYEAKPAMSGPATQLLFVNLGLSGARGFSVPDYIRAELHRRGVPKNEIAYIYDFKSATAKQRLFNDMNEGKVRILLGSVAKMGVGTNVQRRLLAIHNMDPLWYPADDEQRNGRGIRQGNMNPEIGIYDYSTKGTYDSTMWGMMEKKARFIQGFFEGDPSLRDMDDLGEASQYEQAKALTTNDPRLIRFTELKQELERANRRKTAFESDVYNTRQNRQKAAAQIEHYAQRIEDTKKDIKQRIDTRADAFKGMVGKKEFDTRVDFGAALFDRIGEVEDGGTLKGGIKVATVGGFDIYATAHKSNLIKDHTNVDVFMSLNGNATREVSFDTSSLGTVRSIESILHGFESDLAEYQQRLDKASKFFKDSEAKASAKFEGAAEIKALQQQVDDLAAELRASAETPAQVAAVAPDAMADLTGGLTPAAQGKSDKLESMLASAVRAIAGDIGVEFAYDNIDLKDKRGYSDDVKGQKVRGAYVPGKSLVRLALTDNADAMLNSAFHESYHHVEDKLQTPQERDLMQRETERLRDTIKGRTGLTDAQVDGLAGYEVRAIAFSIYSYDRVRGKPDAGKGMHIGVRRWFDRLMDLLARIKNGLKGLGFQTYRDIFSDTYEGKVADRTPGESAIDMDSMAALSDVVDAIKDRVSNKFGERATELRVKLQDRFIRVRNAQDSVGGVRPAQDTYQAESLMPGRTGQRLETLEKEKFEPLVEAMDTRGIGLEEMSDYLYAKHAPERNLAMDAINHPGMLGGRDLRGRGSGMSDDEAKAIMDGITAAGRMADFRAVEAMVRDIQQGTVDALVSYGLLSQETADAWAAQYKHYVPLQGFDEAFEDEMLNMARGMGMDTRARESKQAFGRLSKAAGPLPYIMMQAELAIVRGEKNKVGNTFLRFVNAHPDPNRWTINRPKMVKTIDPRTGLVTMVADSQWHNDPNVFVTKVGGQRVIIRLEGNEGQQLARALKNMGVENMGDFVRFMRMLTMTMARLSTQWNPNFVVPNLVRDLGEAYINLQEQDQKTFVKQFTKHLIPAIGGSFQALRGQSGGRYAAAFREYDAAGGRVRFFGLDNAVDVEKSIQRQMRRLQGGPVATVQEAGKTLADAFDTVNGAMENATRLAAYMAARDVGMSIPASANLALNLTVNFTKKGELGPLFNSFYMFANATMQGGRRTFSALKNKNVRRATYALIGLGALSAMLAYGAGGDDDSGESYYSKVPTWERDKNLIIMWPKGFGRDGGYIKLPLPFLFGAFKVLGDRMVGVMLGKDKVLDSMDAVIKAVLDGLSPLGEEGGSVLSPMALLPSIARPAGHIATNVNWNGRQIYPARDFEKNKPDSEQFFSTTPEYAKAAARGLNKLGGGSPYKSSGTLDVHPGSIQHVLESLTGGLGKFISDVSGTADRAWKGEAFDATKAPVLRRFVGSTNTEQSDASRYYADREEARKNGGEAVKNARRDRAKGVNVSEAESFLANNKNLVGADQIFKNADDAMKPLRERKSRIEAGDSLTDDQRKEVDSIKQRMRDIQNAARKRYRELRGAAQ